MKKAFRNLLSLVLTFLLVFSLFACNNDSQGLDEIIPPDNSIVLPDEDNYDRNNEGHINENIDVTLESFHAVKSLGFEADYQSFQSIIDDDLAFALPSKHGSISIQEYSESLYTQKFHNLNKYIFEARPDDGYYFERWEAYDYSGTYLDVRTQVYDEGNFIGNVYTNVISDYIYYASSIRFVRAIFTDDEEKLVDTYNVPIEATGELDGLVVSPLPDKIVKGTRLYQIVKPKKDYYITDWSSFYSADESITGTNITIGGHSVLLSLSGNDYKGLVFEYDEHCILTGNNSTFGIPDRFFVKTRKASEISPIFYHRIASYPYNMDGSEGWYFGSPNDFDYSHVIFVDRNKPLYLEPSIYGGDTFYGWYDWEGNLLTENYIYFDPNFNEDELHLVVRFAQFSEHLYQGFTEHTKYFRFNPINNGTAWEVIYNYDNTDYIDVLTIPATYKGLPVTRIADRGFAKFWLRDTSSMFQWWFYQAHPNIGRLVIPASIQEVGDYAFATTHNNVSTYSLTSIDEDTDGDHWIDTATDITYEVEFLSINTKVTPFTFSQSGHKFINAWGQMEQILNNLLHTYIDGVYGLKLKMFEDGTHGSSSGFYSLDDPFTIHLSKQLFEENGGRMYFSLLHEFRHFMQFVSVGAIEGATLKTDLGSIYTSFVQDNINNYIPSTNYNDYIDQFIEQDANAFAYAYFGYSLNYARMIVSL